VSVVIDGMLAASGEPQSPFHHRISPGRIGISGHSLGGLTTVLVAQQEPRVRAALACAPAIVNVAPQKQITIPFMAQAGSVDSLAPLPNLQEAYDLAGPPRFLLEILDVGHFAWSDICAAVLFGTRDCNAGTLTQDQAHTLVLRFAVPFLRRYLAGDGSFGSLLTPGSAPPGVILTAEPIR
jgi:predicted dienelactone hydrolase